MGTFLRSRSAGRRWQHSVIVVLLLVSSLLLGACDLGGSSPPASNTQPPSAQQPATTAPGGGQGNSSGGNGGSLGGGTTPATATQNSGAVSQPGPSTAIFDKMAGGIPVNGTDPSGQPVVQMVQKVGPAVVTVVNSLNPAATGGYGGEARGSGAIIDQAGYIITNNHVVADQQSLVVIFADGKKQQVQLVGTAPDSDLAVLKASGQMPAVITLGDSDKLLPGETVVAIGSALGEFVNSVTVGVVSGLHRELDEGNGVTISDLIQTDAAINHGNSGGPLLNLDGELIGINTLGVTSAGQGDIAQGLGFAIPSNTVKNISQRIIKGGGTGQQASNRPYLGVRVQLVNPRLASYYNLVDTNGQLLNRGELVTEVLQGTPAEAAGLQPGDVIVGVDNQQINSQTTLGDVLANHNAGDKVTMTIIRAGKQGTVQVTLGQAPG
jgi:S1-C subfamily serine protease